LAFETPVGNIASIGPVGEKPSQRLNSFGSTEMLSTLTGIASIGMFRRIPVADVESVLV